MPDTSKGRERWVDARSNDGYDWRTLMKALSALKVHGGPEGHGLVVDSSEIAPDNAPATWVLEPGPDGWWSHGPSGTSGPLFECLCSIVLTCIEAGNPLAPQDQDGATIREAITHDPRCCCDTCDAAGDVLAEEAGRELRDAGSLQTQMENLQAAGRALLPYLELDGHPHLAEHDNAVVRFRQALVSPAPVYLTRDIRPDSWLQGPEHRWFLTAYQYARTQTAAIPTLAKVEPEALYNTVWALLRGVGFDTAAAFRGEPTIHQRATAWVAGQDTGLSSLCIWRTMMGVSSAHLDEWRARFYPRDPDDFGRCHRLLEEIPEWRARLPEMAQHGPVWAGLVKRWDEITGLYREEYEPRWNGGEKCYDLMQSIIEAAEEGQGR